MNSRSWPRLGAEEEEAVLRVMRDGNITTHPVIRELEADYVAFSGRRFAVAHNNGTAALMAAFHAIGLQPGDEILVPTATFWASVLPMLWFGLVPVFCNSETERLGPDPEDMRRRITPRTRAMVTVHLWGLPCKWTELKALAEEFDLKVIEDASHAHGATWRGERCGRLGDISVFSLQGDKLAPAGEGGIFLTDEADYHERAICFGDITRILELETPARRFAATSFGVKTRIASVSAAIARVQLAKLEENNRLRNANMRSLSEELESLGFDCFLPPEHIERVYFEFLLRPRDEGLDVAELVSALQAEDCPALHPRYPLLHQQPFFTEGHWRAVGRFPADCQPPELVPADFAATEAVNNSMMRLPVFPGPDDGAMGAVVDAFRKVLG
jgi:dTDP-4-amino-4,6-dideoxygalactose transaminase